MKKLFILLVAALMLTACTAPGDTPVSAPSSQASATRAAIQQLAFDPARVGILQSATLTWTGPEDRSLVHTGALTDPDRLRTLADILSGARRIENIPMCFDAPFRHELTLVLQDGSVMTVLVSVDACAVLRDGDVCYDYRRAARDVTGKDSNEALYDLFDARIF